MSILDHLSLLLIIRLWFSCSACCGIYLTSHVIAIVMIPRRLLVFFFFKGIPGHFVKQCLMVAFFIILSFQWCMYHLWTQLRTISNSSIIHRAGIAIAVSFDIKYYILKIVRTYVYCDVWTRYNFFLELTKTQDQILLLFWRDLNKRNKFPKEFFDNSKYWHTY